MKKVIVFDFDYTLGDSTDGIVISANYALEQLGYPAKSRSEIKRTIGLSLRDTYFALTSGKDSEEAEQFREFFIKRADDVMVENTKLYEGTKEVLTNLKETGYKIGIVTTKFRYRIEKILCKFGLEDLVDLIIGADDVKVEKPNPEGLLRMIDYFHMTKEDLIYVGDSIVDAQAAQNAGVDFVGVLTGTTTEQDFGEYEFCYVGQNLRDCYQYITRNGIRDGNR